jgi:hypothetical protein
LRKRQWQRSSEAELLRPSISELSWKNRISRHRTFVPNPMAQTPSNFGLLSYPNGEQCGKKKPFPFDARGRRPKRNAMNGKSSAD